MFFFRKLFKKHKYENDDSAFHLLDAHIDDEEERRRYVSASLMQMKEISEDIDNLKIEYNAITDYLNDCDEIDRIPRELKIPIEDAAREIISVKENKDKYYLEKPLMDELLYEKMDSLSEDMPEAYEKIRDAEEFQGKIKSDLRHVDGEKQAYYFRRNQLQSMLKNITGVLIIATASCVFCLIVLIVLAFTLELDIKLGFLLTLTIVCVVYAMLFIKGLELRKESDKLDKTIIKIIQLQNSVKIRLVNNTNLLDYYYLKYDTDSSKDLKADYDLYLEEKSRREQYEQASKDLPMAKRRLLNLLKDFPIKDPVSWVHTPEAIIDKNEMVELRHEMINRRQKLRERIDENTKNAQEIRDEIKDMIKRYPKYSVELLGMLNDFEG